jgi:zinc D-Ala-D-Ala carboxypeptidase
MGQFLKSVIGLFSKPSSVVFPPVNTPSVTIPLVATPVFPPPLKTIMPVIEVNTDQNNPRLSTHFTYNMMVVTEHRKYFETNSLEGKKYIENMRKLCNDVLEPIVTLIGEIPIISSCFRCPQLNAAIGGSVRSQHMKAEAADILLRIPLKDVFNKIASSNIAFGQLIYEFGWIHVSIIDKVNYPNNVHQKLRASKEKGKIIYSSISTIQ